MTERPKHETKNTSPLYPRFVAANQGRNYELYTWSMDAALNAKAQSIFPHFGNVQDGAVIVDVGSGTGALAELAAETFRGVHVYAMDISSELQEHAEYNRALTTLKTGDATKEHNFQKGSVDIVYFSTSGHEIESFGESGGMRQAVNVAHRALKDGGRIIIRDFAKPTATDPILMQFLTHDGLGDTEEATQNGIIDYTLLSDRALFLQFHKEFRGGNAFEYEFVTIDGVAYVRVAPEWAHEFYLHKDYRDNWTSEVKEKYTYWTKEDAQNALESAGFTNVHIIPDPNDFILTNRLSGKIALFEESTSGTLIPLPFPDTHMVVVGQKPRSDTTRRLDSFESQTSSINFTELTASIVFNENTSRLAIGSREFPVNSEIPVARGSKKDVYQLNGVPSQVLKVVRTDTPSLSANFKAMYEAISRADILDTYRVPHPDIIEVDLENTPLYRYYVQESVPNDAISAVDLIKSDTLSEIDIQQLAELVNTFEGEKKWQLDTNPFNWYRVPQEDGSTRMVYVDGKVYQYEKNWEFRRVGLLQWIDPQYVSNLPIQSARIPRARDYEELCRSWKTIQNPKAFFWQQYLDPSLQPK